MPNTRYFVNVFAILVLKFDRYEKFFINEGDQYSKWCGTVCVHTEKSAALNTLITVQMFIQSIALFGIHKFNFFICYFQMLEYIFVLSKLKLIP